jgi:hypothetical protein
LQGFLQHFRLRLSDTLRRREPVRKKVFIITFLVVCAAAAGVLTKTSLVSQAGTGRHQSAFTLQSRLTYFNLDDGSQSTQEKVRLVSSGGSWKVILKNEAGEHAEYFFERGRGFFNVDHRGRVLRQRREGSPRPLTALSAEELRAHPQFAGTEEILGLTTYILRVKNEKTGLPETDSYRAVELGGIPLKTVVYDEGRPVIVDEPVSLRFGEPPAEKLKGPGYPVVVE